MYEHVYFGLTAAISAINIYVCIYTLCISIVYKNTESANEPCATTEMKGKFESGHYVYVYMYIYHRDMYICVNVGKKGYSGVIDE